MTMTWATPRTARCLHRCECGRLIPAGERYLSHVAAPGGELGFEGWARMAERVECVARYGRSHLLGSTA